MTLRIKPLEWTDLRDGSMYRADVYKVADTYGQGTKAFVVVRGGLILDYADTADEGMAKAQEDHERRVRSFVCEEDAA